MYYRSESLTSIGEVLISGVDQRVSGLSHIFFGLLSSNWMPMSWRTPGDRLAATERAELILVMAITKGQLFSLPDGEQSVTLK